MAVMLNLTGSVGGPPFIKFFLLRIYSVLSASYTASIDTSSLAR